MKTIIAALCAVFVATSASAAIQQPPKRFDKPFGGLIYTYHHSLAWLFARGAWAYTYIPPPGQKWCEMHMPHRATVGDAFYKELYRHERAHCNGWGPDHPK